jgi:O-antigen ligase
MTSPQRLGAFALTQSVLPQSAPKSILVLSGLMFLIGPLAAVARQGLTALLFLVLLTLAFMPEARTAWRDVFKKQLMFFVAPFFLWALVSNAWAPTAQWAACAQMLLTVIAGTLVIIGLKTFPVEHAHRVLRAVFVGVLVLLVFLLEESMTQAAILSWARPEDVQTADATFFSLIMSLAARGTSVLAVMATLFGILIYRATRSGLIAAFFVLISLFVCARLPMTTSALGLAASILAFICVSWRPRGFLGLMLILIAGGICAAWPLGRLIPSQAHVSAAESQLELGIQHRLGIWRHAAGIAEQEPVLGHGFNASRYFAGRQDKLEGLNLPALPTHPHNAPLQIWLELGAIGALFSVFLVIGVWRSVRPLFNRPVHAAVVASMIAPIAVIACFSYAIWSTWWLAGLGLMGGVAALAIIILPPTFSVHLATPEERTDGLKD